MAPGRWYEDGLRFACTRSGNCCTSHGEYAYVYLSEPDVRAIAAHLGLGRRAFLGRYVEEEDGHLALRMDRPECPFLTAERRCSIYPVRPVQCRTWPFWRENLASEGAWEGIARGTCPGIGQGPRVPADEVDRLARETDEAYGDGEDCVDGETREGGGDGGGR